MTQNPSHSPNYSPAALKNFFSLFIPLPPKPNPNQRRLLVCCWFLTVTMRTLFGVRALEYEDISKYTSNFSEERFITKFQYGTVFRGSNGYQVLTVKVWNDDEDGQKGHDKLIVCGC